MAAQNEQGSTMPLADASLSVTRLEARVSISHDPGHIQIIFFVNETHLTEQKVNQMTPVVRPTPNAAVVV